ncbi:VIR protein [Plasmodium vivax]|uniref:VIR protein n=1 Tax=Plasmodium vivax TaxID=5855 RepID=A0A1G4HG02_PLAVI|nr:VIR protein [Plasmodium vivax]
MAKPAVAEVSAEELEKVAQELGHNELYADFYVEKSNPKFLKDCDELDSLDKTYKGVKKICIKLVSSLEKLAEIGKNKTEYDDYCNYLPHWLFDEVGKIYKPAPSKKDDTIPFFNKLADIGNKVNWKIPRYRCNTLPSRNYVSLDERKNRKNAYIYLKKYEEIKPIINAKGKGKCDQYVKYLNYIDSLNKKYKKDDCRVFFFSSRPNYADCDSKHDPNSLISILKDCKGTDSARGGSTSGGSWFSSLFGSSTGSSRSGKVSSPPENPKAASAAGDKGRQEVSQGVAGTRDSPGLTSSTSLGASARPVVGAAGGGLSGQLVTTPPAVTLIPKAGEKPEQVVHATSSYSSGPGGNALPEPTASPAGALESVSNKLDSNFYRNIIMAAAILGTIFFLFYYNMVNAHSIL